MPHTSRGSAFPLRERGTTKCWMRCPLSIFCLHITSVRRWPHTSRGSAFPLRERGTTKCWMWCPPSIFCLHITSVRKWPHTSRGEILRRKSSGVAKQRTRRACDHGEVSSHFAQAATDLDSVSEPFCLEEAKCESSATTHHTCFRLLYQKSWIF